MSFADVRALGALLHRRLEVAQEEKPRQIDNFKEISAGVTTEQKEEWTAMITAWHEQEDWPEKERTAVNPYAASWTKDDLTVGEVQRDLQADEAAEAQADAEDDEALEEGVRLRGSGTVFLKLGLRLQALQYVLFSLPKPSY